MAEARTNIDKRNWINFFMYFLICKSSLNSVFGRTGKNAGRRYETRLFYLAYSGS